MPKSNLESLLKKARQAEPVPDFQKTWHGAESMGSPRTRPVVFWPRILVPVAVATVVAVLFTVGIQFDEHAPREQGTVTHRISANNRAQTLARLDDVAQWSGELDGLGTEWTFEMTPAKPSGEAIDLSVIAVSNNVPGDAMYESQTDFLLDLDIPTWNRAVERNVL